MPATEKCVTRTEISHKVGSVLVVGTKFFELVLDQVGYFVDSPGHVLFAVGEGSHLTEFTQAQTFVMWRCVSANQLKPLKQLHQ